MRAAARLAALERAVAKLGKRTGWQSPAPKTSALGKLAEPGESVKDTLLRLVVTRIEDGRPVFNAAGVETLARLCLIQEKDQPRMVPWIPHEEQSSFWREACEHDWLYCLKPRQIGKSTAATFLDVVWSGAQDALGNALLTALIWDTDDKAKEQMIKAGSFVRQLGLPTSKEPGVEVIWFPNQSRIKSFTAGGAAMGTSLSFHRVHISELPYWRRASETWGLMQPAMGLNIPVIIETTMDMRGDKLASDIWSSENRFHKTFDRVSDHRNYQDPPETLPDYAWEWLAGEGFLEVTDDGTQVEHRAAAAWWWNKLHGEMHGDVPMMMKAYPQIEQHAFAVSEGMWFEVIPKVTRPVHVQKIESVDGGTKWDLEYYRDPEACSGQYVIAVDVAKGGGGDRSVVLGLDKADRGIVAAFSHNLCHTDDLAKIANELHRKFTVDVQRRRRAGKHAPDFPALRVETNGRWGKDCIEELKILGAPVVPFATGGHDGHTRRAVLLAAKRAVESGEAYGPEVLATEAKELHQKPTENGREAPWVGHDDMSMALGIGQVHIREHPYIEPPEPKGDFSRYDQKKEQRGASPMRSGW